MGSHRDITGSHRDITGSRGDTIGVPWGHCVSHGDTMWVSRQLNGVLTATQWGSHGDTLGVSLGHNGGLVSAMSSCTL